MKSVATEIKCARVGGYKYIRQNIMSADEEKYQKEIIENRYLFDNGCRPKCDCETSDDGRTTAKQMVTPTGVVRLACPPNTNNQCFNNPWDCNKFAINVGKLCLNNNNQLVALQELEPGEALGEYRGIVFQPEHVMSQVLSPAGDMFYMKEIRRAVNASHHGSAMRLINTGCTPNCEALVFVHNKKFKVVYVTSTQVKDGEVLFLKDTSKYPEGKLPICKCGMTNCKKLLGSCKKYYYDGTGLEMPSELNLNCCFGKDLNCYLQTPCAVERCNPSYVENHVHNFLDSVAAIICERNELVVVKARVTGIHKSREGFFYYVVKRPAHFASEYILPMWLVFKHMELAEFRKRHVFTSEERRKLYFFLMSQKTLDKVHSYESEVVPEYVKKVFQNKLAVPTFFSTISLEGDAAVFSTLYSSRILSSNTDFNPPLSLPIGEPSVVSKTEDILKTVTIYTPQVMFARVFDNAAESLALLYLTRLRTSTKPSFYEAFEMMKREISVHYFAVIPRDRKFLLFEHYRIALELEVPGSNYWKWCSLCLLPKTFDSEMSLNQHFHEKHAICARVYACCMRKCAFNTPYPSLYRIHLKSCASQFKDVLGDDFDPDIIDSFADYTALRLKTGGLLHIVQPGLPTCYGFSKNPRESVFGNPTSSTDNGRRKRPKLEKNNVIDMDIVHKRPIDESYTRKAANFRIKTRYKLLTSEQELSFPSRPRIVTKLKLTSATQHDNPTKYSKFAMRPVKKINSYVDSSSSSNDSEDDD